MLEQHRCEVHILVNWETFPGFFTETCSFFAVVKCLVLILLFIICLGGKAVLSV